MSDSDGTAGAIHIGTSGWSYNHWKNGVFYPTGLQSDRWLEHYVQHFPTVEINRSFYRLPTREQFERWAAETPDDFIFAVKASRFLTHLKRLREPAEPVQKLLDVTAGLRRKRGPLLFQLPRNFHRDLERLEDVLRLIPDGVLQTWEFRHVSWLTEDTYALLSRYNAALCIPDGPGVPQALRTTTDWTYIRFHSGSTGIGYTPDEIATWTQRVRDFSRSGVEVYVYWNNDPEGHAIRDAKRMMRLLAGT